MQKTLKPIENKHNFQYLNRLINILLAIGVGLACLKFSMQEWTWWEHSILNIGIIIFILPVPLILIVMKPHYFSFEQQDRKLVFRYMASYYNSIWGRNQPKIVEIPIRFFEKYEIYYSFFQFRKELVLHFQYGGKVVKYEPISISLLSADQEKDLIQTLNLILSKE